MSRSVFFNDTATTEIYTLSLHDALPISAIQQGVLSVYETDGYQAIMDWIEAESGVGWRDSERATKAHRVIADHGRGMTFLRSEEHTSELQSRQYLVCRLLLEKKKYLRQA